MSPFRRLLASYKLVPFLLGLLILLNMGDVSTPMIAWSQQAGVNPAAQSAVGTAFTYQGRLSNNSSGAVTGQYDFQFTLYDAETGGAVIGAAQTKSNVGVSNGVFTVQLDFGPGAFTGAPRWLELAVRQANTGNFETLAPRQPLTPVPYAMFADNAGSVAWANITDKPDDFADNIDNVGTSGGSGDITAVKAGNGLSGGSDSGDAMLSVDFNAVAPFAHTHAGQSWTIAGNGLTVTSIATTGDSYGVAGLSNASNGTGLYGYAQPSSVAANDVPVGVWGRINSAAVGGTGVLGESAATSGVSDGVDGLTQSPAGFGVYGSNTYATPAPTGSYAVGIYGRSRSPGGRGVVGAAGDNTDPTKNTGSSIGVAGFTSASSGFGVYGRNSANDLTNGCCAWGVYGYSDANGGNAAQGYAAAVEGYTVNTNGKNYGVAGFTKSPNGAGIYGRNLSNGPAAYFDGPVTVVGQLTKPAGSFKIDHPLDPTNKYLSHSFVESPDMMNIYNGNILLDGNGEAWVQLPEWFEALNMEFRYQLTPIGAPGPNLYIAQEIVNNRFQIAGGTSNMKVSWQVTGIRHDPYAQAHRIVVEEEKSPAERGSYLYPAEYGQPTTLRSIHQEGQQPNNVEQAAPNVPEKGK